MKRTFVIRDSKILGTLHELLRTTMQTGMLLQVVISPYKDTRSIEQNNKMWAVLTELSKKLEWYGQWLEPEEWKDVITAGLKKQKVVPGIDGGFVVIGAKTSKMSIKQMSDVIELAYATGAEHDVRFAA